MDEKFFVSSSPHISSGNTTSKVMLDVIVALLPAAFASVAFFGFRTVLVMAFAIVSCVASEYLSRRVLRRPNTVGDLSAVVTGLLLALNMPPSIEIWKVCVGGAVAIVLVKQIFGGIGQNFMNPALAARVILLVSYGQSMTNWSAPRFAAAAFSGVDAVSSATPLALAKSLFQTGAASGPMPGYLDLFLGNVPGCLGETSSLALLIGGAYLLWRRVISWHIPATYVATTAILMWVLGGPQGKPFAGNPLYAVLSGGLLLGAIFMATDYSTSPMTAKGKIIMGVGCGALTAVIRLYTNSPEGVSYAIIVMNVVTPLIDRYTIPKVFGAVETAGKGRKQHA